MISPFFRLIFFIFSFIFWLILNFNFYFIRSFFNLFYFIILIGFYVFFSILLGIFRKRKYSYLGSIRFRNQRVSFEIIFFFLIFIILILNKSFLLINNKNILLNFIFLIFLFLVITELNRRPIDLSEGERELVRGFNTEFSRVNFTFLFIGEYNIILFFRIFLRVFYGNLLRFIFILFILIFLRSCFPRFRFDKIIRIF